MAPKIIVVVVTLVALRAVAQPGGQPLEQAFAALESRDYVRAEALANRSLESPIRAERAEASRVLGLARFYLGNRSGAEEAFFEYLKLDLSAHLDPAVTPPEVVIFFEDVRTRRAAELEAARPKARRRPVLNFLPPLGQFQNGERAKGWTIAGVGAALVAVNVTSFVLLSSWCDGQNTCDGHTRAAKRMRKVNLVSAALAIGVYAYGVADGFWNRDRPSNGLALEISGGDASLVFEGRF